jgi:hypothetical protein
MSQALDDEHDIYGLGQREHLVAIKPKVTPESSPDPIGRSVSPPPKQSGGPAKPRRKVEASKGDAYLLRIAYPNQPEVHRRAETHLPSANSDDESMEDVADMDERLAEEMRTGVPLRSKPEPVSPRMQGVAHENMEEEEMVDVADLNEKAAEAEEERNGNEAEVAHEVQQLAVHALSASDAYNDAFRRMGISSPPLHPPASLYTDIDRRRSSSTTATTTTTAPSRKQSDGLGIWIKPEVPSPFTPMTPVEPNFQDPFSAWSPLSGHRNSIGSPGGKLPAILSGPASPEAIGPPTPLPAAKEILKEVERGLVDAQQRNRHASLSSMTMPSPTSHSSYRASFSNAHPSPSMTSEPRSSLVLSPPSGVLRRESYPLPSSASTATSLSIASPSEVASPLMPSPHSPHGQSIDENTRTLPPLPGIGRPTISVATIPSAGSGGYKCDFPGCTAAPFQTSYLLK